MDIVKIVENQHSYFNSRQTFDLNFRMEQLKKLKDSIEQNKAELFDAFMQDLNKTEYDVIMTELSIVMEELDFAIKNLLKLTKPQRTKVSLTNIFSKGRIIAEPYGVVLVVSPWNYPFQLAMVPVIGALAAGNTVVIKPSSSAPNVSLTIQKILSVFDEKYVATIIGSREETQDLFDQKFDFAFFTGGATAGKDLMQRIAKNLTPSIMELGGKSPCIIDFDADLKLAAKRCVWGKFLNAGQTCVAPDYFLVHETIKDKFVALCIEEIKKRYYFGDVLTQNFVKIINKKQTDRLKCMIDYSKVVFGGKFDDEILEPTIMDNVTFEDAIMQEEVFGPVMPIITFSVLEEEIERMKAKERPLALYYFGQDRSKQDFVMNNALYGGGCINNTILHVADKNLPFGGVGSSGHGRYHGAKTFEAFSHYKSVLVSNNKFDVSLKFMPYTARKLKKLKKFFK